MRLPMIITLIALFTTSNYAFFSGSSVKDHKKVPKTNRAILENERNTISVFEENVRAVVNIDNIQNVSSRFSFFMESNHKEKVTAGQGSGFLWDKLGHIVTNYHVAAGGDEFAITFHKDKKKYKAELVGSYPQKDIAVLKLKDFPKSLYPISISNSKSLKVGQKALAIGSPYGLEHTLTTGIISSTGRSVQGVGGVDIKDMIQTDCSINQGNSGGPLLDSSGGVIGMNTMIYSNSGSSAGIGFAVPSSTINEIVPQLITYKKIKRPGIGIIAAGDYVKRKFGLEDGVIVKEVVKGTGADRVGLEGFREGRRGYRMGDVILKVENNLVNNISDIYHSLEGSKIGDYINVTFMRPRKCRNLDMYEELTIEKMIKKRDYVSSGCIDKAKVKLTEIKS